MTPSAIATPGLSYLGMTTDGQRLVFADDRSWDYQVYDLVVNRWLSNPDPDFPRFTLEGDVDAVVVDLDTAERWPLRRAEVA